MKSLSQVGGQQYVTVPREIHEFYRREYETARAEAEALRSVLIEGIDLYREALGCIQIMSRTTDYKSVMRTGEDFLRSVGASRMKRPHTLRD